MMKLNDLLNITINSKIITESKASLILIIATACRFFLYERPAVDQALLGPCQFSPQIGGMVKTGDKLALNRCGVQRRRRSALQHGGKNALIGVMLDHQTVGAGVGIDHEVTGFVERQALRLRGMMG
jgi:hypothetical protein